MNQAVNDACLLSDLRKATKIAKKTDRDRLRPTKTNKDGHAMKKLKHRNLVLFLFIGVVKDRPARRNNKLRPQMSCKAPVDAGASPHESWHSRQPKDRL
jgi:hypothetical protein